MKQQIDLVLARMSSKEVFNRWLALSALIIWAVASFAFDVVKLDVFSLIWIAYFVISYLLAVFLAAFLVWLMRKRYQRKPQLMANLIIAGLAGITKNLSVGLLLEFFGPVQDLLLPVRLVGGALMGIAIFVIFSMLSANRANHLEVLTKLNQRRAELIRLRAKAPEVLQQTNQNLLAKTRDDLARQIETIGDLLSAATTSNISLLDVGRDALQELRSLVTSRVRPLSEQLRSSAQDISLVEPSSEVSTQVVMPKKVQLSLLVSLPTLAFIVFPSTIGSFFITSMQATSFFASFGATLYFGSFALAYPLLRVLKPINTRLAMQSIFLLGLTASLIAVAYLNSILPAGPALNATLIGTMLSGITIPIIIAIQRLYALQRARLEKDLAKQNSRLAHELALFEQQLWLARRNWQFVVHGTVQAALTAAIARLTAAENRGQLEAYEIRLVREDLDRAIKALSTTPENKIDFKQAIADLIATWDGVCKIDLNISSRAKTALVSNQAAAICVLEICKEAISNAVRHGEASLCTVELDRIEDEIIELEITNNGKPPKHVGRSGYGSQMFDELTTSWKRERTPRGETILHAQVPLNYDQSLVLSR